MSHSSLASFWDRPQGRKEGLLSLRVGVTAAAHMLLRGRRPVSVPCYGHLGVCYFQHLQKQVLVLHSIYKRRVSRV